MKKRLSLLIMLLVGAFSLTGCPSAGIYRTAKTLEKGESDFGMTFSFVNVETHYKDENGQDDSWKLSVPNIFPELNYHIGIGNNMEVGGRVAVGSLMGEIDLKYRFYNSGPLHLAVQPAIGYRSAILAVGTHVTFPVIMTYELSDMVSFNVFAYSSYMNIKPADDDIDSSSEDNIWNIEGVTMGGGAGIKITGETFYIMPTVDFSRLVVSLNGDREDWYTDFVIFGVSFGFIGGKEMKKLKKMDEKLDRIEDKIDRI
ncbi:MAG: hypothetical protein JXR95_10150 [Deltaproteobacteria bacterium]|nr:hypothetical protein [Deltaproteobacteria bacterium]